jgi:hypothetical protein
MDRNSMYDFERVIQTVQQMWVDLQSQVPPAAMDSVLPEGRVEPSAFLKKSLTKVVLPDGATRVEAAQFSGCRSLVSVTLPNSVTSIGDFAFQECTSLTDIMIPDSVKSIGQFAFSGCESLTVIKIPKSVMDIGSQAFEGCHSLRSAAVPPHLIRCALLALPSRTRVTVQGPVAPRKPTATAATECDELGVVYLELVAPPPPVQGQAAEWRHAQGQRRRAALPAR